MPTKTTDKNFFKIKANADNIEILIYEDIWEGFDDKYLLRTLLENKGKNVDVYINSYGGDALGGYAMYASLVRHDGKITVYIDGHADSAASVIAMAGSERLIAEGGSIMIHNAWTLAIGDAKMLRKRADDAERISNVMAELYEANSNMDLKTVKKKMQEETTFTAEAAIANGLATGMQEKMAIAAKAGDFFKSCKCPWEQDRFPKRKLKLMETYKISQAV